MRPLTAILNSLAAIPVPFILAISMPEEARAQIQVLPDQESEFLPLIYNAQQAVAFVSRARAYRYATPVSLYPGRTVLIDFRTEEVITYIQLSDLSGMVYQTNAPINSGQAKLITLRQIQELNFPGQTEAPVPNLIVSTIDLDGVQRTYTFNLVPQTAQPLNNDTNGIAIVTAAEAEQERTNLRRNEGELTGVSPLTVDTLQTELGEADINDLAVGIDTAISLDYTTADDPVVIQAQNAIALVEQGVPLRQAIRQAGLPLNVAIALGEIGIERQILPVDQPAETITIPLPEQPEVHELIEGNE